MWNQLTNWYDALLQPSKSAAQGWKTPAIWMGLNKISGNIGILPMEFKHHDGRKTEILRTGPIPSMWRNPSPIYRANVFKQTMTAHALWHGNGRAAIIRQGRQSEMIILDPTRTESGMVNGEKMHITYITPDGNSKVPDGGTSDPSNRLQLYEEMQNNPDKTIVFMDRDVFHLVGFGNGIVGVPLYYAMKTALQSMLGSDDLIDDQINRGFTNKIVLNTPDNSPMFRQQTQADEFLKDFVNKHGTAGLNDAVMLLRGGVTATTLTGMNNDQAQLVEIKKYFREDAAQMLLLENMLGIQDGNSYNSHEQRQLAYLLNLETWLTRWEEEANFKLLSSTQFASGEYYHEFNTAKLTRTDKTTQSATDSSDITARIKSPNEVRESRGMDPYEGGDEYLNPAITTTPETKDEESDDKEESKTEDVVEALAIKSRLNVLLGQEQKQVNKRLGRGDTIQSIEQWYDGYCSRLGNAIETMGGSRDIAQSHCVNSITYLKRRPEHFSLAGTEELLADSIIQDRAINV